MFIVKDPLPAIIVLNKGEQAIATKHAKREPDRKLSLDACAFGVIGNCRKSFCCENAQLFENLMAAVQELLRFHYFCIRDPFYYSTHN